MPEEKSESQEETSLRDTIAEAVEATDVTEEVVEEETPAESDEVEAAEEPDKPEEAAEEASDGEEQAPEEESDEEALDAPTHWALEDQETFRALDAKAQKFLLGRSKDMEAAHTKRSQEIAPLRNTIQKWQPYLDKVGATPEQAFDALIAAEYTLRTGTEAQKKEAFLKLGKDYGISLEEPKANGAAQEDFLAADIRKAVEPLQQEVGTLRQTLAQREASARQAEADKLAETVRQFREAKTEAGLAHPYFDEVRDEMSRLAQADQLAGKMSDLNDLYDRAIHADPAVRAKLQAAQQHAAKLKEKREQKEKVKKAKAAGVSVTGVSTAGPEQPKSLRATLEEAAAGRL